MTRGVWLAGIAAALICRGEERNLVRNPGFEETEPSGATVAWNERKPAYRFVDGAGREGSRGLVFENGDPDFYSFPAQALDLQRGCCYAYEVWVRTEGLSGDESGATVCMEWYDGNRYLGGAYAEGVRGTSKGWQRVHGVTRAIPTHATRVSIAPYVRRGMTGKAWFDDLKVTRYVPPLVRAVSISSYRHVAAQGPVTLRAVLTLDESGVEPSEVTGLFSVETRDGQAVARLQPTLLDKRQAVCTLDARSLPVGTYTVRFGLQMRDGTSRGSAQTYLSRVQSLPERRVFIDEHRRLIVDGQPFFPLGMYWSGIKEKDLDLYAKSPFNCLMPYGSPTTNQMDACQARGLKVIYSIKDFYSGTRWAPAHMKTEADEKAEIQRRVDLHAKHPALIAWYINDELPLEMVDRLAARQRLMEELDPDHPTWVVLYQHDQVDAYLPTFDVIGTDPYPVPDKPVGTALQWTRNTRDLSFGTRAVWQVPQVFDWGAYRQGEAREKTRAPTLAEMRAMTWQCVAAGANGLVFYSFFDLFKMNDRDPFERRWAEVCALGEEIKRYLPVLLSVEPLPQLVCKGPASVETRAWRVGSSLYLLAVNGDTAAAAAEVTVAGGFADLHAEFGQAPKALAGNRLAFRLDPLDPVMVRVTLGTK
ncbi:MAG TPA: hypothetical protein P5111_05975 [Kiritimatiellia bacterium]|nr:hypothetical protein [Kiritimatiellia bacterium]